MGNCIHSSARTYRAAAAQNTPTKQREIDCEATVRSISPPASPLNTMEAPPLAGRIQQPKDSTSEEQFVEDGQKRLRDLVSGELLRCCAQANISRANADDIDWKSIIALAEDLHRKEQQLLRSHNERRFGSGTGWRRKSSLRRLPRSLRRQAFFEKRRRQKEIARRRKLESCGSFSVNLLMYDTDEQRCCRRREDESLGSKDASIIINQDEDACTEGSEGEDALVDSADTIDVFEDDDPSSLYHDATYSTSPSREISDTERPDTPSPFIRSNLTCDATDGSFLATTASSFDWATDDVEECSSSDSLSAGNHWDLMTIDEDATVTDW